MVDISADYAVSSQLFSFGVLCPREWQSVIATIYPQATNAQYGFFELNYRFTRVLNAAKQ